MEHTVDAQHRSLTAEEFLARYGGREGKCALVDGKAVAVSPGRIGHGELKLLVATAIGSAVRGSGLSRTSFHAGTVTKLREHIAPGSLADCQIVNGDGRCGVAHRRRNGDSIMTTQVVSGGALALGAGFTVDVAAFRPGAA